MSTAQKDPGTDVKSSPASGDQPPTIYEMIEEASYLTLENNSRVLLDYVTRLVNEGNTPEKIVEVVMKESKLPRWRVAYLGCAAAYIIKLNSVQTAGRVS